MLQGTTPLFFVFFTCLILDIQLQQVSACSPTISVCAPDRIGANLQTSTLISGSGNCLTLYINGNQTYQSNFIFTSVGECSSIGKCGTVHALALPGQTMTGTFKLAPGASILSLAWSSQATKINSDTVPSQCLSDSFNGSCNTGVACSAPSGWSLSWRSC